MQCCFCFVKIDKDASYELLCTQADLTLCQLSCFKFHLITFKFGRMDSKVVVVLGASSGIGEAIALEYAKQKHIIVLAARRADKLKAVAESCIAFGASDSIAIVTDVTVKEDCSNLIEKTVEKYMAIDIVVYCVGQAMHSLVEDISSIKDMYDKLFDVNFYGAVYTSYYASPYLRVSAGQLIVVSSVAGVVSPPFVSLYSAAKHAVNGFFEALQNEEPGYDVCVVCPGYVATEFDDKKIVWDGTVQPVDLNVDRTKYMTPEKAACLIIEAAKKKKKMYYLTSLSSVGVTMQAVFPGFVHKKVRQEMATITSSSTQKTNNK